MIVRRYEARNLEEALAEVKRDLGPNAVVLSSRRIPRWEALKAAISRSSMEVVAAVPPDSPKPEEKTRSPSRRGQGAGSTYLESRGVNETPIEPSHYRKLLALLKSSGVDELIGRRILNGLMEKAGNGLVWDDKTLPARLARALVHWIPTSGPIRFTPGMPRVVAFVGPTGSGKTTNLIKLVSRYALKNTPQVVLVTMDTFKVGGLEQFSFFGEILGVPVEVARDSQDLADIVDKYSLASLIAVDTPGRGPSDTQHIAHLRGAFRRIPSVEVHLVLSVTTRDQEMEAAAKGFYEVPFHRVFFTKVDEGVVLGPMLNLAWKLNCPISYVSTGQRIPEDLEVATPERITDLILKAHWESELKDY